MLKHRRRVPMLSECECKSSAAFYAWLHGCVEKGKQLVQDVEEAEARAAFIWILGEHGQTIQVASRLYMLQHACLPHLTCGILYLYIAGIKSVQQTGRCSTALGRRCQFASLCIVNICFCLLSG